MFGLGWGELVIVLLAIAIIYGLFFSASLRRRLNEAPPSLAPEPPVLPAARPEAAVGPARSAAEEILAERYARGELTDEEFIAKRNVLRQDGPA